MPDSNSPNILFIFTDQQRPGWLEMDDVPVRTPTLAGLAESGTRFQNAICPSPVCNPSRACLASGNEYERCGVQSNDDDYPAVHLPSLYYRLREEAGYHVMGCGKSDLTSTYTHGLEGDENIEQLGFSEATFTHAKCNTVWAIRDDPDGEPKGPYQAHLAEHDLLETHVQDYLDRFADDKQWVSTFPTPIPHEHYYDEWITRQAQALLEEAPTDQPWFFQVNLQNPHHPWDISEEMHGWYRSPPIDFPLPEHCDLDIDAETHQEIRRNYAAMVEHLDQCVGRILETVGDRGEREETIVVFSSDHGEMLGDYSQWQKMSPYQASIGVPLIVDGTDIIDRDPVTAPTTILDLHATFLEQAGITIPDRIDSRSMQPFLTGQSQSPPRDVVRSALSAWRVVFDGQYKLIEGYDPAKRRGNDYEPLEVDTETKARLRREREPVLVDVTADERHNVREDNPAVFERLQRALGTGVA